jgi:hypothetical protein
MSVEGLLCARIAVAVAGVCSWAAMCGVWCPAGARRGGEMWGAVRMAGCFGDPECVYC